MNLRPAILDQGLVAAIQWLSGNFSKRTGIETLVRAPVQLEHLPKTVQLVAYRTAQEALTNIGKHAQCRQVKVDLSDDGDVLTLEVADDGQGLADIDLSKADSYGIRGLKERAKARGGWIDVSSQPGRGTSIILSVPAPRDAASRQENNLHDTGNSV